MAGAGLAGWAAWALRVGWIRIRWWKYTRRSEPRAFWTYVGLLFFLSSILFTSAVLLGFGIV